MRHDRASGTHMHVHISKGAYFCVIAGRVRLDGQLKVGRALLPGTHLVQAISSFQQELQVCELPGHTGSFQ